MKKISIFLLMACFLLLVGCAKPRPDNIDNICSIFNQYPDWYEDAKRAQEKWGIPIATQMAIIHQESGFNASAKPPRKKLLWIIPWKRPSSAYGYSQALKNTWKDYESQTGQWARRSAFDDATDFIGWYGDQVFRKLGIRTTNTYAIYLAYHEGPGGYASRDYLKKPWLIRIARRVTYKAETYRQQLASCEDKFR